jgi:hypothetical protein
MQYGQAFTICFFRAKGDPKKFVLQVLAPKARLAPPQVAQLISPTRVSASDSLTTCCV